MLSDTAEYALRAVLYIAQHATAERPLRTEEIAGALQVPRNYLSKILHVLGRQGVLASTRGPQGGFRLAGAADDLPLQRVVQPFDAVAERRTCLLGRAECSETNPCPAHSRWSAISSQVQALFLGTTIGDLLREKGSLV
ncbi:MAG TPA: Rrf2 family transcriptional regulator [Longimicrobiales bacterium]|nr:Rrf2 family transcriptional regulator [Longimicrobiales bacterium]